MGSAKPNVAALFSNRFAGNVKYTPAEWEAVQKDTPSIDVMLRQA